MKCTTTVSKNDIDVTSLEEYTNQYIQIQLEKHSLYRDEVKKEIVKMYTAGVSFNEIAMCLNAFFKVKLYKVTTIKDCIYKMIIQGEILRREKKD